MYSNDNYLTITRTQVHHSEDESNRNLYENLEMRRLGLPTQFSNVKMKRQRHHKNQKLHQSFHDRVIRNSYCSIDNHFEITPISLLNYGDNTFENDPILNTDLNVTNNKNSHEVDEPPKIKDTNYHTEDCFDYEIENEVEQEQSIQERPEENDTMESSLIVENMKQQNIDNNFEDIVDEFPSMILSTSSYDNDFLVSVAENLNPMVDNDDDDITNYENNNHDKNDEMDPDFVPMKKKSSKKKIKNRLNVYWRQRFILFSRFNEGIKMDKESWYSVTPEAIARHIAKRVQNALFKRYSFRTDGFIVMDPFCGAGGNVIQFALQPLIQKVYAIDIDPKKIAMAKHNAQIYECEDKIEFLIGDFFEMVRHNRFRDLIDVCFYSPPWGGPDYINLKKYSLNQMTPNGFDICRHTSKYLTENIVLLLPRNFDETELQLISDIVYNVNPLRPAQARMVELEKNMIFNKVKTMTAYFGDTIDGLNLVPTKVLFE